MAISTTRWNPFEQMERMQRELDRLFTTVSAEGGGERRGPWLPAVDVEQTAEAMILKLDLPGVSRDDVKIDAHDGVLTISGEREEERHEEHEGYVMRERVSGSFARSFTLPAKAQADKITAAMDDGVLKVTIPRPAEESPRQISID